MRFLKSNFISRLINSYLVDSPQPVNISYLWNFGSLLGVCLILQLVTGIFLAMHYQPHVDFAFNSVEHIMRDVNNGWAVRYTHANVASFFFIFVYAHIGRGLYYGSYRTPRVALWTIGVIILILMMAIAFLGYVLPYGQMSLWGATVITNLLSAIPFFGQDLVELIWGGFSVSNATLNRFFSLHYLLPFVLAALVVLHLMALHTNGSNNPNGYSSNDDRVGMHPYFTFKDLVTIFLFFLVLSIMVFFYPNALGHSDNYIPANPMSTPASIVPEWYLLPFYAILRSIPNKLLGVIAMFGSLLILLILPIVDFSRTRGSQFSPLKKFAFWSLVVDFSILMWIGSQHPEEPYVFIGQMATAYYFAWFLIIIPLIGIFENTIADFTFSKNSNQSHKVNTMETSVSPFYSTYTSIKNIIIQFLKLRRGMNQKSKIPNIPFHRFIFNLVLVDLVVRMEIYFKYNSLYFLENIYFYFSIFIIIYTFTYSYLNYRIVKNTVNNSSRLAYCAHLSLLLPIVLGLIVSILRLLYHIIPGFYMSFYLNFDFDLNFYSKIFIIGISLLSIFINIFTFHNIFFFSDWSLRKFIPLRKKICFLRHPKARTGKNVLYGSAVATVIDLNEPFINPPAIIQENAGVINHPAKNLFEGENLHKDFANKHGIMSKKPTNLTDFQDISWEKSQIIYQIKKNDFLITQTNNRINQMNLILNKKEPLVVFGNESEVNFHRRNKANALYTRDQHLLPALTKFKDQGIELQTELKHLNLKEQEFNSKRSWIQMITGR